MKAPPFNGRALIALTSEHRVRTRRQQQHVRISTVAVTYHEKLCAHRSEGKREGRGRERYGGRERETGWRATDEREIQEERVRAKKRGGALLGVSLMYIFFMLKTKGLQRPGVFLRL
jgi:hypothetical protein